MLLTCYIIGDDSLAAQCGALLLAKKGYEILGMCSSNLANRTWALENKIDIIAFKNLAKALKQNSCDYLFSISNKRILNEQILNLPKKSSINYHNALLPQYGGVYSTSWAILRGEAEHGITWHIMTEKVDGGPILIQSKVPIAPDDTADSLNTNFHKNI